MVLTNFWISCYRIKQLHIWIVTAYVGKTYKTMLEEDCSSFYRSLGFALFVYLQKSFQMNQANIKEELC